MANAELEGNGATEVEIGTVCVVGVGDRQVGVQTGVHQREVGRLHLVGVGQTEVGRPRHREGHLNVRAQIVVTLIPTGNRQLTPGGVAVVRALADGRGALVTRGPREEHVLVERGAGRLQVEQVRPLALES